MVNVMIEAALALAVVGVVLTLIWMINVLDDIRAVLSSMQESARDTAEHLDGVENTLMEMDGGIFGIGTRMQYWIDRDKGIRK